MSLESSWQQRVSYIRFGLRRRRNPHSMLHHTSSARECPVCCSSATCWGLARPNSHHLHNHLYHPSSTMDMFRNIIKRAAHAMPTAERDKADAHAPSAPAAASEEPLSGRSVGHMSSIFQGLQETLFGRSHHNLTPPTFPMTTFNEGNM